MFSDAQTIPPSFQNQPSKVSFVLESFFLFLHETYIRNNFESSRMPEREKFNHKMSFSDDFIAVTWKMTLWQASDYG